MVHGAQEYPPLQAEPAAALFLFRVSVVGSTGRRVETFVGTGYPYLVHSLHLSSVGQASGCCRIREAVLVYALILPFHHHFTEPYECLLRAARAVMEYEGEVEAKWLQLGPWSTLESSCVG